MKIMLGLAVALLAGCASPTAPTSEWDLVTPLGIEVATGGHAIDAAALDRAFVEQAMCFSYVGTDRPRIRIVEPTRYDGRCGIFPYAGIEVYGVGGAHIILMPPDCCAAAHEFAHFIHYRIRGTFGENGGECAL